MDVAGQVDMRHVHTKTDAGRAPDTAAGCTRRVPEDEPSVVACGVVVAVGVVVVAPRVAAAVTWWWRCFFLYFSKYFLRSVGLALGNVFAECSTKNTRQRQLCRVLFCRVPFARCNTRQTLCRVFFCLRRVPWAHSQHMNSGSGYIVLSATMENKP